MDFVFAVLDMGRAGYRLLSGGLRRANELKATPTKGLIIRRRWSRWR
jgi:hypothetical protein